MQRTLTIAWCAGRYIHLLSREPLMPSRWISNTRLRPHTDADIPFMKALYRGTREAELRLMPLTPAQADAFIEQQFQSQLAHYTGGNYGNDHLDIVEVDGQPAGRLFVDYRNHEIRIIDITLAPAVRDQRLGEFLLSLVIAESQRTALPITIHVDHTNPARRLYERMGFRLKEEGSHIYLLMERLPDVD